MNDIQICQIVDIQLCQICERWYKYVKYVTFGAEKGKYFENLVEVVDALLRLDLGEDHDVAPGHPQHLF